MIVSPVQNVFAHVVSKSDETNSSAVIHITPGDDPIVGKESEIYIDIGNDINNYANYSLSVATERSTTDVPVRIENTSIVGRYIFPKTGEYKLLLSSEAGLLYSFTQTVTRTSETSNSSLILLFLTIVASILALTAGVIFAIKKYHK